MSKSKIEWCTDTWNPIYGCTPISPGCENCYAKNWHDRFKDGDFSVILKPEKLLEPLKAKKPKRYFVGSMTDIFHDDVPDEFLDKMFAVMAMAANHTFMVLTKRPERKKAYFDYIDRDEAIGSEEMLMAEAMGEKFKGNFRGPTHRRLPIPNIWLGVTAENQEQADKRIPILLETPAAYRFVSVEPMLGSVDLDYLSLGVVKLDALAGNKGIFRPFGGENNKLDWVICGGESGRGSRSLRSDLVRKLRNQCKKTNTPFFFKQWGEFDELGKRVGKKAAGRLLDGEEVMEWPETLKPS